MALVFLLALLAGTSDTTAQNQEGGDDSGLFLVARRGLSDPLFRESVILMLPKNETPLVVGLIVNKPARVLLRDLFPKSQILRKDDTTAYFGGPVDVRSRSALFRSKTPPKQAIAVFDDVYVTFDSTLVAALADGSEQASDLRFFLGRSQWARAQLQNEIAYGSWYTLRGDADPIFSRHPETAWRTLLKKLEPPPFVEYRPPSVRLSPACCWSNLARWGVAKLGRADCGG